MWPVELGREESRGRLEDLVPRLSSATSFLSALTWADSSVVVPGRVPESIWSRRTHWRTVSAVPMPSLLATAFIAAHSVS